MRPTPIAHSQSSLHAYSFACVRHISCVLVWHPLLLNAQSLPLLSVNTVQALCRVVQAILESASEDGVSLFALLEGAGAWDWVALLLSSHWLVDAPKYISGGAHRLGSWLSLWGLLLLAVEGSRVSLKALLLHESVTLRWVHSKELGLRLSVDRLLHR